MRTALTSPKAKRGFVPRVELLEDRCTPAATVSQFGPSTAVGALVVINQDPGGGLITIQDNGTSNTGAIKVFWNGFQVFSLDGPKVDASKPIQVLIFGSTQNNTVIYNLVGNLTTDKTQLPAAPPNPLGQNPNGSGGRLILAQLFARSTDTFAFNWPLTSTPTAIQANGTASGLLDAARFQLQVSSTARTEYLSANLNIDAFNATVFIGMQAGKGVDHVAVNENIFDLTGTDSSFPASTAATVSNASFVDVAQAKTGSQVVDLPVLTPGLSTTGSQLNNQNLEFVFGNGNSLAAILPIVMQTGLRPSNVLFV
jgi:hypothetical protein